MPTLICYWKKIHSLHFYCGLHALITCVEAYLIAGKDAAEGPGTSTASLQLQGTNMIQCSKMASKTCKWEYSLVGCPSMSMIYYGVHNSCVLTFDIIGTLKVAGEIYMNCHNKGEYHSNKNCVYLAIHQSVHNWESVNLNNLTSKHN